MRIAFVGKGGSGKTTLAALFARYIQQQNPSLPLLAVDADLNIHLPELLGFPKDIPEELHISHPAAARAIKTHLRGRNERIRETAHFRKTTPPGRGSNLITLHDPADPILGRFGIGGEGMRLILVGTYDTDDIGASCYHNNLAILENVLSHLVDRQGCVVADMVAGVDAFANTLHAQFDLLALVVEPTRRGVEVFEQYDRLAQDAGVGDRLVVIGNKVRSEGDATFLRGRIPSEKMLGALGESDYLRRKDQTGGTLDPSELEPENARLLGLVWKRLNAQAYAPAERLRRLWDLHRRYVAQDFIRERFGDLTGQIDESFALESP